MATGVPLEALERRDRLVQQGCLSILVPVAAAAAAITSTGAAAPTAAAAAAAAAEPD